jgi:hypothetical protein
MSTRWPATGVLEPATTSVPEIVIVWPYLMVLALADRVSAVGAGAAA